MAGALQGSLVAIPKGKKAKKLGEHSQAILGGVAAAVSRALGIGDPTATGIAVLVADYGGSGDKECVL